MTQETLDVGPRKVFVVSPIGKLGSGENRRANYALKYLIREALQEPEWVVHRADEGRTPDSIGQHVIKQIWEADLIVADLTDHNPNVFYELAIAHGWRKPVVHIITEGQKIPFDIVDIRTIFYDITDLASVEESIVILRDYANEAFGKGETMVTPLSSFAKFSAVANGPESAAEASAFMFEEISVRLNRLDDRMRRLSDAQGSWLPSRQAMDSADRRVREFVEVCRKIDSLAGDESSGLERGELLYRAENLWRKASPETRSAMKQKLDWAGITFPL